MRLSCHLPVAGGGWLYTLVAALVSSFLVLVLLPDVSRGQDEPGLTVDEAPGGAPYAAGELLVAFDRGVGDDRAREVARGTGAEVQKTIPELGSRVLVFPELKNEQAQQARESGLERARRALERNPNTRSADYNYLAEPAFTPNDPLFGNQWGIPKVRAPEAWNLSQGATRGSGWWTAA